MASVIQLTWSLTVMRDNFVIGRPNRSFTIPPIGTANGPVPGAILVPTHGVDVDLGQLGLVGMAEIANYDPTNYFMVGIRDPSSNKFYPMLEIGPLQSFPVPLSRKIETDFFNTGTGSVGEINFLHLKAVGAACQGYVGAYER